MTKTRAIAPDFYHTDAWQGQGATPFPLHPFPVAGREQKEKPMARPSKDPAEQLTYRVNFRTTLAEGQQLEAAADAAGLTVSDYARGRATGAKPRRRKASPERAGFITALGQLGHIRADINQILKDRFAHKFIDPARAERALAAIEDIADQIHKALGYGD